MATRRGGRSSAGRASLQEVRQALKGGWPPGLVLLAGEDRFHLDAAQRELGVLLERRPDFNRQVIDWLMFTDKNWNEYLVEGLVMSGWEAK